VALPSGQPWSHDVGACRRFHPPDPGSEIECPGSPGFLQLFILSLGHRPHSGGAEPGSLVP